MRSRLTDNGNHVSPSRRNVNDKDKPKKNGNLDAELSARIADWQLRMKEAHRDLAATAEVALQTFTPPMRRRLFPF